MKPKTGVCYYPEHWPEDKWARDAARMREAGLSHVRIGEFAWSRMEPAPGRYDWDWLDRAFETLGAQGLGIVLGTPTATPPKWLCDRMPDMFAVDARGAVMGFGSRRHYCFSHEGYKAECARIVDAMAQRYGRHDALYAWQTDNEYGCHNTSVSYSRSSLHAFRDWLAQRYQSPDALNRAWGNVFWSMEYASFDEIGLPMLTPAECNPAHILDFRRFTSDRIVAFNRLQCDAIRRHSDRPISHNFMGRETGFDHFALGADLDFASWDSYPLGFLEQAQGVDDAFRARFAQQGDPDMQAFHHDLYRATGKGRWWVMEQQPGPVNWAERNPCPLAGMVRLWGAEAAAHGAEAVSYFRWRQAPFAQEQMHAGLERPDGEDAPGKAEAARLGGELGDFPDWEQPQARVALVYDYEAAWAFGAGGRQSSDFDYFRFMLSFYRALRANGLTIDFIPPDAASLAGYGLVVAPGVLWWRPAFLKALQGFDGVFVAGPRAGAKTAHFAIPAALPPDLPGMALKVARIETRRANAPWELEGGGAFRFWAEEVETGGEVVVTRADGMPALVRSGKLHYLTGWPDQQAAERLMRQMARTAGLATVSLPEGLRIRDIGKRRFVANYSAAAQSLSPLGLKGQISPADYLWYEPEV